MSLWSIQFQQVLCWLLSEWDHIISHPFARCSEQQKPENYKLIMSLFSDATTTGQGQRRGQTRRNSVLSVPFSVSVSMETRRQGGTGRGVAMGTDRVCKHVFCVNVNECARLPCSTRVWAVRVASWSFRYFSGRSLSIAYSNGKDRWGERVKR